MPHTNVDAPATPQTLREPLLLPRDLNILPLGQNNYLPIEKNSPERARKEFCNFHLTQTHHRHLPLRPLAISPDPTRLGPVEKGSQQSMRPKKEGNKFIMNTSRESRHTISHLSSSLDHPRSAPFLLKPCKLSRVSPFTRPEQQSDFPGSLPEGKGYAHQGWTHV